MKSPVNARFNLLKQLFRLAQQQRTALQADQIQRFEALLDRRQGVIDALAEPPPDQVPANVIPFPGTAPTEEDRMAIDTLLRGILEMDQENEVLLREKMAELGTSLRRIQRGHQAAAGYKVPPQRRGGLDRAV